MESVSDKRSKFLKIYPNVPEDLREDILIVVDGKSYTWNTAYLEIKDNTELGKKILKALEGVII
jgi:hypothetical protein